MVPSEVEELFAISRPLVRLLSEIEMPAASDVPMQVDFAVDEAGIELLDTVGAVHVRAAMNSRLSVAGGVYDPARQKALVSVEGLSVETTSPACEGHRILLAPCTAGLRFHRGPVRIRAVGDVSDVHVHVSDDQIRLLEQLLSALAACPPLLPIEPEIALSSSADASPVAMARAMSVAESGSEVSEYFDAVEDFATEDPELVATPAAAEPWGQHAADLQCEARLGLLIVTLLENCVSDLGSPVLQLTLDTSRANVSQSARGGLLLGARLQLGVHHYVNELHRWEPVLASCRACAPSLSH